MTHPQGTDPQGAVPQGADSQGTVPYDSGCGSKPR